MTDETPGSNAMNAPENKPDGDWRAAFGSLRTEVVGLEGEVRAQGATLTRVADTIDRMGTKVDTIASNQAGMQHSSGRISAQTILGMIAVITPIVVAAALLGHTFVRSETDNLEDSTATNRSLIQSNSEAIAGLAKAQTDFVVRMTESRWTEDDHDRYHLQEVAPMATIVADSEEQIARIDERLKALTAIVESHVGARDHPDGVLLEMEKLRGELRELRGASQRPKP